MQFFGTAKFPLLYRGVITHSKEDSTLQSALGKLVRIFGCLNDSYLMGKSQGHYPLLEIKKLSHVPCDFWRSSQLETSVDEKPCLIILTDPRTKHILMYKYKTFWDLVLTFTEFWNILNIRGLSKHFFIIYFQHNLCSDQRIFQCAQHHLIPLKSLETSSIA